MPNARCIFQCVLSGAGMGVDVPKALLDFIREGDKFLIAGHIEPDGDCVGSQLALASALRRLGKEALPCSAGPFKRPEIKAYENRFLAEIDGEARTGARVIIVDCAAPERTGGLARCLEGLPTAVIDHHSGGQYAAGLESTGPVYVDGDAPATTILILSIIKALGLEPVPAEAEWLFFGLCTDTGFFRHVDKRGAAVFAAAAELAASGANPKTTFQRIHGGKSLGSRILIGRILSRVESRFGGRLLLSTEEYEETQQYGREGRDSDAVYQLLQDVEGTEAIAILRQEEPVQDGPGKVAVGLRSRDALDVAAIARAFGGGGHKNAAGASVPGDAADLKGCLLEAFAAAFENPGTR